MMNCEQLLQYLSDYIDHNLNEELTLEARKHLETCHNCHVILDTTQKTITLCRASGRCIIPSERRMALFNRLQSALNERS
jgi:anti-sigma factor RsiW